MPLTDVACRNATCPAGKPRERYSDGLGMYLEVSPTGRKYWRLKYRFGPKEKRLALGIYPEVTLAAARRARDKARELLSEGRALSPRARKPSSFAKLRLRTRSKRSHAPGMSSGRRPGRITTLNT
jgi:hypothetical protein